MVDIGAEHVLVSQVLTFCFFSTKNFNIEHRNVNRNFNIDHRNLNRNFSVEQTCPRHLVTLQVVACVKSGTWFMQRTISVALFCSVKYQYHLK